MRSRDKLEVEISPLAKKRWVKIRNRNNDPWIVLSFEDLFRIVRGLLHCERLKYGATVESPSDYVRNFLLRCVDAADYLDNLPLEKEDYETEWQSLADEFEFPERTRTPEKIKQKRRAI
jgi:hypothetical protein